MSPGRERRRVPLSEGPWDERLMTEYCGQARKPEASSKAGCLLSDSDGNDPSILSRDVGRMESSLLVVATRLLGGAAEPLRVGRKREARRKV